MGPLQIVICSALFSINIWSYASTHTFPLSILKTKAPVKSPISIPGGGSRNQDKVYAWLAYKAQSNAARRLE